MGKSLDQGLNPRSAADKPWGDQGMSLACFLFFKMGKVSLKDEGEN